MINKTLAGGGVFCREAPEKATSNHEMEKAHIQRVLAAGDGQIVRI